VASRDSYVKPVPEQEWMERRQALEAESVTQESMAPPPSSSETRSESKETRTEEPAPRSEASEERSRPRRRRTRRVGTPTRLIGTGRQEDDD
jgi:hypothetical protein